MMKKIISRCVLQDRKNFRRIFQAYSINFSQPNGRPQTKTKLKTFLKKEQAQDTLANPKQ